MNQARNHVWTLATLLAATSCGHPADKRLLRDDSTSVAANQIDSEEQERSGLDFTVQTFDERAVVLLQITVPYCRNDFPEMLVSKFCSGTVISNRHVLTAAHCFATECPGKTTLPMARIKMPAKPSAPGFDMTNYDWSQDTISPINLAIVGGGSQAVGYTKTGTAFKHNKKSYATYQTTVDQVVLDFGPNALSQNYPEVPISTSVPTGSVPFDFYVVGHGSLDGRSFKRQSTARMKSSMKVHTFVDSGPDDKQFTFVPVNNSGNQVACYGDSGGPLVYQKSDSSAAHMIGLASVKFQNDIVDLYAGQKNSGDSTSCSGRQSATFSLIIPGRINEAIASMTSPVTEKDIDIDLWNPKVAGDGTGPSNAVRFISTLVTPYAATPTSSAVPMSTAPTISWAQIPNPTNPTQMIPSHYAGGFLRAIQAGNTSTRSATWSASGLKAGKYKVELFYRTETANATCVAVQFRTTGQAGFPATSTWLDQKGGTLKVGTTAYTRSQVTTSVGTALGTFAPVVTILNPKTYITIKNGATLNSGTLSVKISDTGCASGRIIADTIRLTWMSN